MPAGPRASEPRSTSASANHTQQRRNEMDIYDEAIAYFQEHPGEIKDAWNQPKGHEYGCLFAYLSPIDTLDMDIGCPSLVHDGGDSTSGIPWFDEVIRALPLPRSPLNQPDEDAA